MHCLHHYAAIEIENHLPWPQHGRLCLLQEVLSGASTAFTNLVC